MTALGQALKVPASDNQPEKGAAWDGRQSDGTRFTENQCLDQLVGRTTTAWPFVACFVSSDFVVVIVAPSTAMQKEQKELRKQLELSSWSRSVSPKSAPRAAI
jgi:hypothetical protein